MTSGRRTRPGSTSAGQCTAAATLAHREQAPTSDRTIEWQNASATTVATSRPSGSRRQCQLEQGAHRRRALAPPAERREVVLAEQRRAAAWSIASTSSGAAVREHVVPPQRVGAERVLATR